MKAAERIHSEDQAVDLFVVDNCGMLLTDFVLSLVNFS
jgi:hypothetical protein